MAGCSPNASPTTASSTAASSSSPRASSPPASEKRSGIPQQLAGLPLAVADVGGLQLRVAVADTPEARRAGLMGVTDFDVVEGMAFVFEAPTDTGFFMKNVPAPLDIAFVGPDGAVLQVLTMATCDADPCPTYHSPAPFLWALEAPEGVLAGIEVGDRFVLRQAP